MTALIDSGLVGSEAVHELAPLASVSVVVPAYNEEATVAAVVRQIRQQAGDDLELVIVNDGSTDGTSAELRSVSHLVDVLIEFPRNRGRGAAVKAGAAAASGAIIVFQDADLELDASIIPELVAPILAGEADAVLGNRVHADNRPLMTRGQWWANRIITAAASLVIGTRLHDVETAAKAFPRRLLPSLELRSDSFELEPELVIKLARVGARITEIPIAFRPRTKAEGKKIRAIDGPIALRTILRYGRWHPRSVAPTEELAFLAA